jgi:hypothetical protein
MKRLLTLSLLAVALVCALGIGAPTPAFAYQLCSQLDGMACQVGRQYWCVDDSGSDPMGCTCYQGHLICPVF